MISVDQSGGVRMKKIKIMSIFGTRPEAIKMAPVVKALEKDQAIESIVCVTAQHREMLDQVLDLFHITPDYDLNIMKSGQTLSDITCRILKGIEEVLIEAKPDMILVHGDTSTTFSASLAAFYQQIEVGHVEAGLRSGNKWSPFPEEMNRSLTGRLADLHFSPTQGNYANLIKENVSKDVIVITGNTVIDALLMAVKEDYTFDYEYLNKIDYVNNKTILLTAHRRENLGKPMEQIFQAMLDVLQHNQNVEIIFPVHLNPKVRNLANQYFENVERVHLIEPLDYEPFVNLQARVDIVLTDSGGIQEEAPSLGKPVLVMRTETERPEAVDAGTVKIVGIETQAIFEATHKLLNSQEAYKSMANAVNPYGDGQASQKIVEAIKSYFSKNE